MSNTQIPFIPENAPFSIEQRAWLNGMFAGLYSKQKADATNSVQEKKITILFGSQTGTTESLTNELSDFLEENQYKCKIIDLSDYSASQLKEEKEIILITSTYGDGEPPDNALTFYEELSALEESLSHLNYAVLGLGDSSYPKFCQCAKDFDQFFNKLGATALFPRIDCDLDYEKPFESFKSKLLKNPEKTKAKQVEKRKEYNKKNPFEAQLKNNYNLHNAESEKETRHIEIELDPKKCSYEAGDALGVFPVNDELLVQEILSKIYLDGSEEVIYNDVKRDCYSVLKNNLNIATITDKLITLISTNTEYPSFIKFVKNKEKQKEFLLGKEIIDLLFFCNNKINPQDFIDALKEIVPRLYSISSSPKKHINEVHLTVGVVDYFSSGRQRKGLCSNFLKNLTPNKKLNIFVHKNNSFRLPDSNKDVIMVGPGTGIAPFRAFIEERDVQKAVGKNWLFFGNPHEATDYFYKEELDDYFTKGVLTKLSLAFSRDQKSKVYVQDLMLKNKKELYQWLIDGASIYICGDASKMAKDVDKILHQIYEIEGQMTSEESSICIKKLIQEKRYLRDVY